MPNLPQLAQVPIPAEAGDQGLRRWASAFTQAFVRLWITLVHTVNALCKVDTAANRLTTPELNETFYFAHDTDRLFVAVSGAWEEVGRLDGVAGGAVLFTEISDPAAPATNAARLYVRDNGAGKSQIVCRFASGSVQVIATEP